MLSLTPRAVVGNHRTLHSREQKSKKKEAGELQDDDSSANDQHIDFEGKQSVQPIRSFDPLQTYEYKC